MNHGLAILLFLAAALAGYLAFAYPPTVNNVLLDASFLVIVAMFLTVMVREMDRRLRRSASTRAPATRRIVQHRAPRPRTSRRVNVHS